MRHAWLQVAILLGTASTLMAQQDIEITPESVWSSATTATNAGRWAEAVETWERLLAAPQWPFATDDRRRGDAELALIRCVRMTGASARADTMAADLATRHRDDALAPALLAAATLIRMDRMPGMTYEAALTPVLARREMTAEEWRVFHATLAAWTDGDPRVASAIGAWLARSPQASAVAAGWAAALSARGRSALLIAHTEAILAAARGAEADVPVGLTLAAAWTDAGQPERAQALLRELRMTDDAALVLQASWMDAEHARTLDRNALARDLARGLDNPLASARDDDALLGALAGRAPGAAVAVDEALAAYLRARPMHPRRASLRLLHVRWGLRHRDPEAGVARAEAVWTALGGTPDERTARGLVLDALLAAGLGEEAGDLAMALATPINPEAKRDTTMLKRALTAYRSAGAVAKAMTVAQDCINEKGVLLDALQVLLWAGQRADGTGDVAGARQCFELVAQAMPEHDMARTARALLAVPQPDPTAR